MAPRIKLDPVTQSVAGVMTTRCECGWEIVTIQPEEHVMVMQLVFEHLKLVHNIVFPNIGFFWHLP